MGSRRAGKQQWHVDSRGGLGSNSGRWAAEELGSNSGTWIAEGLGSNSGREAVDQIIESAFDDISIMKSTTNSSCLEHGDSASAQRRHSRPGLLSTYTISSRDRAASQSLMTSEEKEMALPQAPDQATVISGHNWRISNRQRVMMT